MPELKNLVFTSALGINSLASIFIAFVAFRNRTRSNKLILLSLSQLFFFGTTVAINVATKSETEASALLEARIALSCGCLAQLHVLLFAIWFSPQKKASLVNSVIAILWTILLQVLFWATPLALEGMESNPVTGWALKPGPLMPLYSLFMTYCWVIPIITFFVRHRRTRGLLRTQAAYVATAYIFGFAASLGTVMPVSAQASFFVAALPYLMTPLFPLVLLYAIVRHRLWDIRTVIHRTSVWALLVTVLVIPIYFIFWACSSFLTNLSTRESAALLTSVFVLGYVYLRAVKPRLDHIFHRREFDLRITLNRVSKEMASLGTVQEVTKKLVQSLKQTIYPESVNVTVKFEKPKTGLEFENRFLTRVAEINQSVDRSQLSSDSRFKEIISDAEDYFNGAGCQVVLPLVHKDDLIGVVLLGDKKNLRPYTQEDFVYIEALATSAAVGLANALLYSKVTAQKHDLEIAWEKQNLLNKRLIEAKEEEGARISRELHDELGQLLTGAKIGLGLVVRQLGKKNSVPEFTSYRERIEDVLKTIEQGINAVRRITKELRPVMLDVIGLVGTIEWLIGELEKKTELEIWFENTLDDKGLDPSFATAVFRIFQESLTNVVRHSQATRVLVNLGQEDAILTATIWDNGIGITEDQKTNPHSVGLFGMLERLRPYRGELSIDGQTDTGTTVILRVPIVKARTSRSGEVMAPPNQGRLNGPEWA